MGYRRFYVVKNPHFEAALEGWMVVSTDELEIQAMMEHPYDPPRGYTLECNGIPEERYFLVEPGGNPARLEDWYEHAIRPSSSCPGFDSFSEANAHRSDIIRKLENRKHSHDGNCCTGFGDPVFEPPKWWQFGRRLRRWWHARRIGKFNEFAFPIVNSTFPSLDAEELVKVQPMVDRPPRQEDRSYNGKVYLDGPAIGRLFAGNQAGHLREIGVEVPEHVPDCASINERGAFTWYKVEFTLLPKEKTK